MSGRKAGDIDTGWACRNWSHGLPDIRMFHKTLSVSQFMWVFRVGNYFDFSGVIGWGGDFEVFGDSALNSGVVLDGGSIGFMTHECGECGGSDASGFSIGTELMSGGVERRSFLAVWPDYFVDWGLFNFCFMYSVRI